MDKTIYERPQLEVIRMDVGDVLTMSGGEETGGNEPP